MTGPKKVPRVPGKGARGQTTACRSAEKLMGGTEGNRNPICRAVIRKIGRQEINEWTMSQ